MPNYEKLDVYQCAVTFLAMVAGLVPTIPCRQSLLADQLKRASLSIPLNIAEGSGKSTPNDSRRFYAIARGSAMECAAALDACRIMRIGNQKTIREAKDLTERIVAMLSKMVRF